MIKPVLVEPPNTPKHSNQHSTLTVAAGHLLRRVDIFRDDGCRSVDISYFGRTNKNLAASTVISNANNDYGSRISARRTSDSTRRSLDEPVREKERLLLLRIEHGI